MNARAVTEGRKLARAKTMTRAEIALSLAGGAIGGAAAITGMWLGRRLLQDVAAKPYSQPGAVVTSITNLRGARR